MEPIGWSYAVDGHGLKELEYGVVECQWHVFNKYSLDVVGAGCFVAMRSRKASLKIARVSLPMIMCCVGGVWL